MDISSFLPPVYHWILCHHFNLSEHCAQAILITLAGLLNFLQFFYLHQNDIIPDLAYILKRNHILFFPPKDSAKAATIMWVMQPFSGLNSKSPTKPSFLQSQMLMTSFFLNQKYA